VKGPLAVLSLLLAFASFFSGLVVPITALLANRRLLLRNEDRHVSGIPFVGSILGLFALLLAPLGSLAERFVWSWVPFAVEATVFGVSIAYWHFRRPVESGVPSPAEPLAAAGGLVAPLLRLPE